MTVPTGQGAHGAIDHGVAGHLVDGCTIVGAVLDMVAPAVTGTHHHGGKVEAELVPEQSVAPVDGGVGLHVMSQVGVQTMLGNVSQDQNDGTTSGLEDIMER